MPESVIHSYPVWLPQTQTWMYTQISELPTDRFDSHVVCHFTANLDQFAPPHIHIFRDEHPLRYQLSRISRKIGGRYSSTFLREIVEKTGASLVHSHFGDVGWRDLPAVRKNDVKHIVTFYGYDVGRLPALEPAWHTRYAELFDAVDLVLCEGDFMAQSIAFLGCPHEKIQTHHLGIDTARIKFQPLDWTPGTPLRILLSASFVEKKGLPYAIAALARLKDELPIEVTIIGDAPGVANDNPEKRKIMEGIATGGLEPHVTILGYQPYQRLIEEAYRHHIFLSPSVTAADGDSEGGAPVTLIEMAAAGVNIVSSQHCDIPSVVLHKRTGLLAEERNVDEITAHLSWYAHHPDNWRSMLEAGRAHIEHEYNGHLQGKRLADIYEGLLRAQDA
tara:strand:+ start:20260 stop:21429 length:1170 start_codon:yes stop_codon:yes gene_type:complete